MNLSDDAKDALVRSLAVILVGKFAPRATDEERQRADELLGEAKRVLVQEGIRALTEIRDQVAGNQRRQTAAQDLIALYAHPNLAELAARIKALYDQPGDR